MLLIISQSKKTSRSIGETFQYMGILSYGTTPHDALSEVSELYRAALIVYPESFPDIIDYVNRIKSYRKDLPVFALTYDTPFSYYYDIFDGIFTRHTFTPSLAEKIIEFANINKRAKIGAYFLAGLDASSDRVGVYYFYDKINFTKTESMILRYLIRSYPIPQSPRNILKYAFKPSRVPEESTIRTHISVMNSKFKSTIGRPMLTSVPGRGYMILTPEYEHTDKEIPQRKQK